MLSGALTDHAHYHYQLVITSPDGVVHTADTTFTANWPVIGSFAVARGKLVSGGTATVGYMESESATTTITIARCSNSKGSRCVGPTPTNTFLHRDRKGRNNVRFVLRGLHRALGAGLYELRAVPHSGIGSGPAETAVFRVR